MSQVIACPKCNKKYQVKSDVAGKQLQCAVCKTKFQIGGRQTANPSAQKHVPAQTNPAEMASMGIDANMPASHGLFPDAGPAHAAGAGPLDNHVIQDPGFAAVDVEEIRRDREREARKNNKLANAFSSSSSIADIDANKKKHGRTNGYLSADTVFDFDGRISRKMFFISSLLVGFIQMLVIVPGLFLIMLIASLAGLDPEKDVVIVWTLLTMFMLVVGGIAFWVGLALQTKRFHDIGQPGSRWLIGFIPFYGSVVIFIDLVLTGSDPKRNTYGNPPPLNPTLFGKKPRQIKKNDGS